MCLTWRLMLSATVARKSQAVRTVVWRSKPPQPCRSGKLYPCPVWRGDESWWPRWVCVTRQASSGGETHTDPTLVMTCDARLRRSATDTLCAVAPYRIPMPRHPTSVQGRAFCGHARTPHMAAIRGYARYAFLSDFTSTCSMYSSYVQYEY